MYGWQGCLLLYFLLRVVLEVWIHPCMPSSTEMTSGWQMNHKCQKLQLQISKLQFKWKAKIRNVCTPIVSSGLWLLLQVQFPYCINSNQNQDCFQIHIQTDPLHKISNLLLTSDPYSITNFEMRKKPQFDKLTMHSKVELRCRMLTMSTDVTITATLLFSRKKSTATPGCSTLVWLQYQRSLSLCAIKGIWSSCQVLYGIREMTTQDLHINGDMIRIRPTRNENYFHSHLRLMFRGPEYEALSLVCQMRVHKEFAFSNKLLGTHDIILPHEFRLREWVLQWFCMLKDQVYDNCETSKVVCKWAL